MKTWEMMQHSGKKFKRKSDGFVIEITPDGTLHWNSGYRFLNTNDEWEEVKEPVDFMTAITSGKYIKVKCAIETYEGKGELIGIHYRQPSDMLRTLAGYGDEVAIDIILNGDWYIE